MILCLNYRHLFSPSFFSARELLCIWVSARDFSPGGFFFQGLYQQHGQMPVSQLTPRDNWLSFSRSSVHTTKASKILISLLINTLQSYVVLERGIGSQNLGPTGSWDLRGIEGEKACWGRDTRSESRRPAWWKRRKWLLRGLRCLKSLPTGILVLGFLNLMERMPAQCRMPAWENGIKRTPIKSE